MFSNGFHLPSKVVYLLLILGQLLEAICQIFLSYSLMIVILFLPFTITALQMGTAMIEQPTVSQDVRTQYAQEAVDIIVSGKDNSRTYNFDELSHLLDLRKVLFTLLIVDIVAGIILAYLLLNNQRFSLISRTKVSVGFAIGIILFTFLTALIFPFFFAVLHAIFFPQGNFIFPNESPLIQAFPLTFWLFCYLFMQAGVLLILGIQIFFSHRKDVRGY